MTKDDDNGELVPIFGTSIMSAAESSKLVEAMEDTANEGGRMGDVSFMSFSGKKGTYSIGVDKREPGSQEPWLVAIPSFELGYMCWKGGKPISKRMATITQPKIAEPDPDEFGPFSEKHGEGWFRARAIVARSLENHEQVYFAINSKSGVAAMSDLQRDVLARMKAGQPCWPVVIFGEEEFESQGYKNYKPKIDVTHWLSTEQVEKLADPNLDPLSLLGDTPRDKEPAPAPQQRRRL
jgi:hypothetical protein